MKRISGILIIAISLMMSACIPSLHPFFKAENVIFDEALVGKWAEPDDKETWVFEKKGDKEYLLTYTDSDGAAGKFDVHLFKLDGKMYFDFYPVELDEKSNGFYMFHLFPVHTMLHVKQITPTLQMAAMDPQWMETYLEKNPGSIKAEKLQDRILITASTDELQAFFLKHINDEGLLGEYSDLRKMPEKTPDNS